MNFYLNRPLWPKYSTGRTMHFTYSKTRPSIYLFKASIALESSANIFVFGWSVVSYHYSNTQQLWAPVFYSYGTSPWTSLMRNPTPLAHSLLYLAIQGLKLAIFISSYGPETTQLLPMLNPVLLLPASQLSDPGASRILPRPAWWVLNHPGSGKWPSANLKQHIRCISH